MILRAAIILGLVTGTFNQAVAQTKLDLSKIPENTKIEWKTNRGAESTTFIGKRNRHWVTNYVQNGKNGGTYQRYSNRRGQTVKIIIPSGAFADFKPHNCYRKIGKCKYTEIRGDGSVYKWMRKTSWDGKMFHEEKYFRNNKKLILTTKSSFTVGADGIVLKRKTQRFRDGALVREEWHRRK